ncbi:MAG: hypothetical protein ACJ8FS_16450 [Sphingomicrobium sp.]
MIELRITGENASDLVSQLASVAQLLTSTGAVTEAKSAGRGRGKTAPVEPEAAGAAQADPAAVSGATPTRDEIATKCTLFSSKGGTQALKELFIEAGSPEGKWSKVPDENLPALNARLDELLAA